MNESALGKKYRIDLDNECYLHWSENGTQRRDLNCVPDVVNGGWLPLEVLDIPARRN